MQWQNPGRRNVNCFTTNKRTFHIRWIAFWHCLSSSTDSKSHEILSGLPGVQCFLDEILCTRADDEEHLHNLDARLHPLQKPKDCGLRVQKEKHDFFQSSVEYLGHVFDATGLYTAPFKIIIRSFIGIWFPNLVLSLKPLHYLLHKDNAWK